MAENIYLLWILAMGALIFLMQAGFFLLEGGQVRSRDVANVLMKMLGHIGVGISVFYLVGFAIKQYGWPLARPPFGWLPFGFEQNGVAMLGFYVSLMFALVSCAIPSGSFSGRMKYGAYCLFALLYVGLIYPVFAYMLWNGFLARLGVQDYAGSLGVHAVGGIIGLVGAAMLGKRRVAGAGHDVPMMGFGALLLMFCWFGFNLGSVPSYGHMTQDLPTVALNTLMAIAGGILGSLVGTSLRGKPDPLITPNGALAGAVVICSGAHLVHPIYALLIGVVAGAQIPFTARWFQKTWDLDDPCGVGPVHAVPGLLGGIFAGLYAPFIPNGFHGYTVRLLPQLLATLVALVYALGAGTACFWFIKKAMGLRVSEEEELRGLDQAEHGMPAYPEFVPLFEAAEGNGQHLHRHLHVLSGVRVKEVMRPDCVFVEIQDMLEAVEDLMFEAEEFALPVVEGGRLAGIITISDLRRIERAERGRVRVAAIFTRNPFVAFPDQTMHEVFEIIGRHGIGTLPVVSRRDEGKLLGLISKTDVINAYRQAVAAA